MITYSTDEYNKDNESQDIHCLFCGTKITPNEEDGIVGDCAHIMFTCTSETWDNPENSKEEFFTDFNIEEDLSDYMDHLEKTLDDSYLLVISASHHLDAVYLFKQK